MASKSGPDIVENGLTLFLDASNVRSYPGSGTTWTDLSGNSNNGTLTNGPTFNAGNMGNIVFDGTNDYVGVPTTGLINTAISADIWFYLTSTKLYNSLIGSNVTEKYEMLIKNNGTDLEVSLSPNNLMQYNNVIPLNNWTNITMTAVSGIQWKLYKNGVYLGVPTSFSGTWQVSGTSITSFDIGRIRNNSLGTFVFSGYISIVKIYNRELTAAEVLQNYNATKSRFGR